MQNLMKVIDLKLEIIKLKDYIFLIDRNTKLTYNDWHIEKNQIINQYPDYLTDLDECLKIVSSTKLLEGLPILMISNDINRDELTKKELWIEVEIESFQVRKNKQDFFEPYNETYMPKIRKNIIKAIWK